MNPISSVQTIENTLRGQFLKSQDRLDGVSPTNEEIGEQDDSISGDEGMNHIAFFLPYIMNRYACILLYRLERK